MSRITTALKKASEQRSNAVSPSEESARIFVKINKESKMHKTWFTWALVTTTVVAVFVAFNYHGGKDAVPLSEIFPDEETFFAGIEYEFVQDEVVQKVNKEDVAAILEKPVIASTGSKVPIEAFDIKNTEDPFNYTVQIASFKDLKMAEEALAKIRINTSSAFVSSHDLGAKGVWYRIYVGQFELRSEAEVTLNNVKQSYDSSFIISPRKIK